MHNVNGPITGRIPITDRVDPITDCTACWGHFSEKKPRQKYFHIKKDLGLPPYQILTELDQPSNSWDTGVLILFKSPQYFECHRMKSRCFFSLIQSFLYEELNEIKLLFVFTKITMQMSFSGWYGVKYQIRKSLMLHKNYYHFFVYRDA